jgi:tetratricopeptide (TPR) repeat protein
LYSLVGEPRSDRRRLLAEANKSRARGRNRRAIHIYRQLLAEDAQDVEVQVKLAGLLAGEGERFESWNIYRSAGKLLLADRRHEQCLVTFKEAARALPYEFEAWRITAELEQKLGREEEAYQTLLEGRRQFRTRFDSAQAIELLRLARQIEPWDHDVVLDLARQYAQSDQSARALRLLDTQAVHSEGHDLRAVRWAQWQISHSFHYLRLWLRGAFGELSWRSHDEAPDPGRAGFQVRMR